MKEVLLFGDSIRLSYQEMVKEQLADVANVSYPDENGRFANYTLNSMRFWKANFPEKVDLIHWNNGIWDICDYYGEESCFTSLSDYIRDLKRIVNGMRYLYGNEVKIIFALTTPQGDEKIDARVVEYNKAAVETLVPLGVEINDLYSVIASNRKEYIYEDGMHLSPIAKPIAAKVVADKIKMYLQNSLLSKSIMQ